MVDFDNQQVSSRAQKFYFNICES